MSCLLTSRDALVQNAVQPCWRQVLFNARHMITVCTTLALLIRGWDDLARDDVNVIVANPKTGARVQDAGWMVWQQPQHQWQQQWLCRMELMRVQLTPDGKRCVVSGLRRAVARSRRRLAGPLSLLSSASLQPSHSCPALRSRRCPLDLLWPVGPQAGAGHPGSHSVRYQGELGTPGSVWCCRAGYHWVAAEHVHPACAGCPGGHCMCDQGEVLARALQHACMGLEPNERVLQQGAMALLMVAALRKRTGVAAKARPGPSPHCPHVAAGV